MYVHRAPENAIYSLWAYRISWLINGQVKSLDNRVWLCRNQFFFLNIPLSLHSLSILHSISLDNHKLILFTRITWRSVRLGVHYTANIAWQTGGATNEQPTVKVPLSFIQKKRKCRTRVNNRVPTKQIFSMEWRWKCRMQKKTAHA